MDGARLLDRHDLRHHQHLQNAGDEHRSSNSSKRPARPPGKHPGGPAGCTFDARRSLSGAVGGNNYIATGPRRRHRGSRGYRRHGGGRCRGRHRGRCGRRGGRGRGGCPGGRHGRLQGNFGGGERGAVAGVAGHVGDAAVELLGEKAVPAVTKCGDGYSVGGVWVLRECGFLRVGASDGC